MTGISRYEFICDCSPEGTGQCGTEPFTHGAWVSYADHAAAAAAKDAEIARLRALLRSAAWYGPADYTTAVEWERARRAALDEEVQP